MRPELNHEPSPESLPPPQPRRGDCLPAERDAREAELFRGFLLETPDSVYFKDLEGRILACSERLDASVRDRGFPRGAVGMTDFELHPMLAEITYADEREIIRTGTPKLDMVEKAIIGSEDVYWNVTSKFPLRNDTGKTVGTFGVTRFRGQGRSGGPEVQQRTHRALETQRLAAGPADLDSIMNVVCTRGLEMTGAMGSAVFVPEPNGDLGTAAGSGSLPVGSDVVATSVSAAAFAAKEAVLCHDTEHWEHAGVRALSAVRSVLAVPVLQGGRAVGILTVVSSAVSAFEEEDAGTLDLLALVLSAAMSRAALEEASGRFRATFDFAPTGMAIVGLDGRLQRVNQAFCRLVDWSEQHLIGTNYEDYTPAEGHEERVAGVLRMVAGEYEIDTIETQLVRSDGTPIWVTRSVSCVRDADGAPLYLVPQITDISERKQAERETARLLLLEREHVERLQSVDKLKDEFVAAVSHELRTPLTSILGYLELALDEDTGVLNEDQRKFLETVGRNSERLLLLVADLLSVAQAEAGQLELHLADLDLSALVEESVESARPSAAARKIWLEHWTDKLPVYNGDPVRLAQLLDNLISNALKFTPDGGRVSVTLAQSDGAAVIAVSDTGIGIPLAEQAHLFERFFRSEGATSGAIQGTGLGLSISRAIAESHGGSISFDSADGTGTTFRVELPFPG